MFLFEESSKAHSSFPSSHSVIIVPLKENIKEHVYFKEHFDQNKWNLIEAKEVTPSFIPALQDNKDVSYFDQEFTSGDVEQQDEVYITIEKVFFKLI